MILIKLPCLHWFHYCQIAAKRNLSLIKCHIWFLFLHQGCTERSLLGALNRGGAPPFCRQSWLWKSIQAVHEWRPTSEGAVRREENGWTRREAENSDKKQVVNLYLYWSWIILKRKQIMKPIDMDESHLTTWGGCTLRRNGWTRREAENTDKEQVVNLYRYWLRSIQPIVKPMNGQENAWMASNDMGRKKTVQHFKNNKL